MKNATLFLDSPLVFNTLRVREEGSEGRVKPALFANRYLLS